jgi:predicted nucleotidyltransferase
MKHALQRLAIRTQFPPLTWLYQAFYRLAIYFCVRRFKAMSGVRAVYLRRGLVSGEPFYGLSDIDLLVVIEGEPARRLASRVQYQYDLLRRLFPMLAEGELAVYSVQRLRLLYEYSTFYRRRFDEGRRKWRRLHGEDVFQHLPPAPDGSTVPLAQELGPAWHYLSQELSPRDGRPLYLRKYVTYKWLADAARAALAAEGNTARVSRDTALSRAAVLFPEISTTLQDVGRYRQNLLAPDLVPTDDVLAAYLHLAPVALATRAQMPRVHHRLSIGAPPPDGPSVYLSEESLALIERAVNGLSGVQRAVLLPRLDLTPLARVGMDVSQLAGATMDALDLVLVGERLPSAQALRAFRQIVAPLRPAVDAYFCDGQLAVALQTVQGWPIRHPSQQPEFFALLSSTSPLAGRLEVAASVEVNCPFEHPDALQQRAESWLALIRTGDAFRLPVLGFFVLFWEAARAAWMSAQSRDSTINVPVCSAQLVETLCRWTPQAAVVLRQIHCEYLQALRNEPSEALRYMRWAGQYARQLGTLPDSSAQPDLEPPATPRTELTVSVMLVTRNRAALLNRALASLVRQERLPDQVVVVDNASSDDTPSVARSYAGALNVTLVREEKVGIPHARNAGLAACDADIIASLDDDCEADPCWLAELERPFLKDPHIGAVGGSVVPLDGQQGLVARFYHSRMQPAPARRCAREGVQ